MGYSGNRPDNLTRQGGHKNPDMSQPHPVNSQITHTHTRHENMTIYTPTLSKGREGETQSSFLYSEDKL